MGQTTISYLHMPVTSRLDRVAARHAERKSRRWAKWLLLIVLAAGVAFGLWRGTIWLLGNTFMKVQGVEVNGLNYINREEIDTALQGFKLDNILEADTDGIERQLATLDYIAEVSAGKVYPNRIVINIKERVPVAYCMQAGNLVALSADGFLLPVDTRLGAPAMPLFFGAVVSQGESDDEVGLSRNMLATLGTIKVELPQLYAQIESVKSSAQTLRLTDESVVVCGWQNTKEDFARLCAVRSLMNSQGEKATSFDLRYHNQVIVKGITGGVSGSNEAPVIVANPATPANTANQQMLAKKEITPRKSEITAKTDLNTKPKARKETAKKTNTSSTTGSKSKVKAGNSSAPKTGKKVGR